MSLPTTSPVSITSGGDGNLWFTEGGKIGRLTAGGAFSEFVDPNDPVGAGGSGSGDITKGPDSNVWFISRGGALAEITPSGAITQYGPYAGATVNGGLTTGPDGNLWIGIDDSAPHYYIGKVSAAGALLAKYAIPRTLLCYMRRPEPTVTFGSRKVLAGR